MPNRASGGATKRNRQAPLRVLLAPCGFKENLLVGELIECMALGVAAAAPNAEILRAPMVDGGEGFTRTLVELTSGTLESVTVTGPVGQKISAEIGLLGGAHRGHEIAAAAGLRHVPHDARDPRKTTSYGVGELIGYALDLGATRLLIGCGDSGVSDGGIGLAEALGARPLDRHGRKIGRGGGALRRLASIDLSAIDPRLRRARIEVAVNWQNVLLGPRGVGARGGARDSGGGYLPRARH
jgi:glycerate 2-kinase